MPRFHFNIVNGLGRFPDEEGRELPSAEHALNEALKGARSLLSEEIAEGRLDLRGRIELTDKQGSLLQVLQFQEVVEIVTGRLPGSQPSGAEI